MQRTTDGTTWVDAGSVASPLDEPNTKGTTKSFTDPGSNANTPYLYRVVARNTVGYGAEFPEMTVTSISDQASYSLPPTTITASASPNPVKATQSTTLRATLTSNGTPQSGQSVQLCHKPSTTWLCPTSTTNASGVATLAVNAPNRAGTFPVVAKFLGSATLRASQSAQYDVNIQAVVASATPNPVARNTNTTLKATLTSGATPTAGQTVQILLQAEHHLALPRCHDQRVGSGQQGRQGSQRRRHDAGGGEMDDQPGDPVAATQREHRLREEPSR